MTVPITIFNKLKIKKDEINIERRLFQMNKTTETIYTKLERFSMQKEKRYDKAVHLTNIKTNDKEQIFLKNLNNEERTKYIFKKKLFEAFAPVDDEEIKIEEIMQGIQQVSDLKNNGVLFNWNNFTPNQMTHLRERSNSKLWSKFKFRAPNSQNVMKTSDPAVNANVVTHRFSVNLPSLVQRPHNFIIEPKKLDIRRNPSFFIKNTIPSTISKFHEMNSTRGSKLNIHNFFTPDFDEKLELDSITIHNNFSKRLGNTNANNTNYFNKTNQSAIKKNNQNNITNNNTNCNTNNNTNTHFSNNISNNNTITQFSHMSTNPQSIIKSLIGPIINDTEKITKSIEHMRKHRKAFSQ